METAATIADMRRLVALARSGGSKIGFVPTMGALHQGHAALIEEAVRRCDWVAVSIFVNPLQFGPTEDFQQYPRTIETDTRFLQERGVDCLFRPDSSEMYPDGGVGVSVEVGRLGDVLCGASRPGHFKGVATVVVKLLNIVTPDEAYFGEKDYQQLLVVKAVVGALDMQVDIVGVPTVREADGLAASSRNDYMSPPERAAASVVPRALAAVTDKVAGGERDVHRLLATARSVLDSESRVHLEYLTICDTSTMREVTRIEDEALVAVAVRVGSTRLIDNILVRMV